MTALVANWFEDDDPRDLRRWAIAAIVVLGVHAAAIAGYLYIHIPDEIGDDFTPVAVDFAPSNDTVDQLAVEPVPEQQQPEVQQPPPPDTSQATVALDEQKPQKIEEQKPPTPAMQARVKGGAPHIDATWETGLVRHLQEYKRYPGGAQSRGEEGIVTLSFSVDRSGHVLARRVVHSSGYPELDQEVISMIDRAQPLPAFPSNMSETKLDLTVPIRFSLK